MRAGAGHRRLRKPLFCVIWFCFVACSVTRAQSQGGNWSSGLVSSSQDLGLLERGSCGYGAIGAERWPYGFGASLAAQNSLQGLTTGWGGCGTCLEVECSAADVHAFSGDTNQGGRCTGDARIVVQVLDICSNCTGDFLTLTPAAATQLGLQSREGGNATAVKYRQVQCQPPGNITVRVDGYKEDNTWLRFQLLDIAGGGVPSSIQVRKTTEGGGDGAWRYMSNQYGAAWQAVDLPPPPLDMLVTGASGRDRVFLRSVLSEPGLGDFATGAQFPPDDSLPAGPLPAPPWPATAGTPLPQPEPARPAVAAGPLFPFPAAVAPAPQAQGPAIPVGEVQGPGLAETPMEVAGPVEASPGPSHAAPAPSSVTLSPGFQLLQPNVTSAIPLDVATQAGLPLCVPAREGNDTVCIPVVDGSSPLGSVSAFNVSAGVAIATEQPLTLVPIRDLAVAGTGPAAGGLGTGPAAAPIGAVPPTASFPASVGLPPEVLPQPPVAQGPILLEPNPLSPGQTLLTSPPPSLEPLAPLQSPVAVPAVGLMEAVPPLNVEPLPPVGSPQAAAGPFAVAAPPAGALIDSLPIVTAPLGLSAVAPSLPGSVAPVGTAVEEMPASAPGQLEIVLPVAEGPYAVPPTIPETLVPGGMAWEEMPASAPALSDLDARLGISLEGPALSLAPVLQPEEGTADLAPAPAQPGSRPNVLDQITSGLLTSAPALERARAPSPLPMAAPSPITLNPRPLAADAVFTAAAPVPPGEYEDLPTAPPLPVVQMTNGLGQARFADDKATTLVENRLMLAPSPGMMPIDASAALSASSPEGAPAPDATQSSGGGEYFMKRGAGSDSAGRLLRSAGWAPELNGPAAGPSGDSTLVQQTSRDRSPQAAPPAEAAMLARPDGALPPEGTPAAVSAGSLEQPPLPVGPLQPDAAAAPVDSTQDTASLASSSLVQGAPSSREGLPPALATITCQGSDLPSAGCVSPPISSVPAPCSEVARQPIGGTIATGQEDARGSVRAESPHPSDAQPAETPLLSPSPQGESHSPAAVDGSPSLASGPASIAAMDEAESASAAPEASVASPSTSEAESASPTAEAASVSQPAPEVESASPAPEAGSESASPPEDESPILGHDPGAGVVDRAESIANGVLPPLEPRTASYRDDAPVSEGPAQGPPLASVDATGEGPSSMSAIPNNDAAAPSGLDIPPRDPTSAALLGPQPAVVPTGPLSAESPAEMHVPLNQQIESGVLPQIIALPFTDPELLGAVLAPAPSIAEPTPAEPPSIVPAVDPPVSLPPEQQQGEGPPPLTNDVVAQSDGNTPAGGSTSGAVMHGADPPARDVGGHATTDMLASAHLDVDPAGDNSPSMAPVQSRTGVMAEAPSSTPADPPVSQDPEQDALLQQVATGQLRQLRASMPRVPESAYSQKGSMDLGLTSLRPARKVTLSHFASTFLSASTRPNFQKAADGHSSSSRKLLVSPPLAPPQARSPPLPPKPLPPPTGVHSPPASAPAPHTAPPAPTAPSPNPAGRPTPATPYVSPKASPAPSASPVAPKHPIAAPSPRVLLADPLPSLPPKSLAPTTGVHPPASAPHPAPSTPMAPSSSPVGRPAPITPSTSPHVSSTPSASPPAAAPKNPPLAPSPMGSTPKSPPPVPSSPTPGPHVPPSVPPGGPSKPTVVSFSMNSSPPFSPPRAPGMSGPPTAPPSPGNATPPPPAGFQFFALSTPEPIPTAAPTSPEGGSNPSSSSSNPNTNSPVEGATPVATQDPTPSPTGVLVPARTPSDESPPGNAGGTEPGTGSSNAPPSLSEQVEGGNLEGGPVPTTGVPGFDGGTPAATEAPTSGTTQPAVAGPAQG